MTAPDLTLRVVMVSADITDDIDAGLNLNAEPTVILQGSLEAVKSAAKLFGEQVAITRAPLAEALAVPEVAALVDAAEGLSAILDKHETKGPLPDIAMMLCWLAAQNVRAALRAIGEGADG